MAHDSSRKLAWMDLLWLAFLGGLAVLPIHPDAHKYLILAGIGIFQISERWFLAHAGPRGRAYSLILKIELASLLIAHTASEPITSSYYLIYYLPVISAAMFFGPFGTLLWTALTSAAYCFFLIPALENYELTSEGALELGIRILFFFLPAILVNRFVTDSRRQAEALAETNRRLEQAETERRRSERLAALGQLSAGLAHELRNPLSVIKGSAETLAKKVQASDSVTAELAGYISSEVDRLNIFVTRFLDFARPLRLETRPEDVTALIDRALKAVRDRLPEARVEVSREFAAKLPRVRADADLAEQVFANLISNAFEAMPAGGHLRLSAAAASSDGRRGVEVKVEDTGPGVPLELRDQIFNPFFTTKKSGVGLGLAIVSKIVDDHGGSIRVSGEAGKGACFRVFLPAE